VIIFAAIKGVLNPNFRPFSFELNKNRFKKNEFWYRFCDFGNWRYL